MNLVVKSSPLAPPLADVQNPTSVEIFDGENLMMLFLFPAPGHLPMLIKRGDPDFEKEVEMAGFKTKKQKASGQPICYTTKTER